MCFVHRRARARWRAAASQCPPPCAGASRAMCPDRPMPLPPTGSRCTASSNFFTATLVVLQVAVADAKAVRGVERRSNRLGLVVEVTASSQARRIRLSFASPSNASSRSGLPRAPRHTPSPRRRAAPALRASRPAADAPARNPAPSARGAGTRRRRAGASRDRGSRGHRRRQDARARRGWRSGTRCSHSPRSRWTRTSSTCARTSAGCRLR